MSRAKIERRKRRRRLAAEQNRLANEADLDITDSDDVTAGRRRFWQSAPEADDAAEGARATKARPQVADETDAPEESPQPPPLSLALGALLSVVFAASLVLQGIGNFSGQPVLGAIAFVAGVLLAVDIYYVYKRRWWAWILLVIVLSFVTLSIPVMSIVNSAPGFVLGMPFTVAPLLLLLLPGTRAEVGANRRA